MKKGISFTKEFAVLLSIVSAVVLLASFAIALPEGPNTITDRSSGAHTNESGPIRLDAKAGNVTALVVQHTRTTQAWQGYYGNISGTITLDDAGNFTLYDWSLPNPQGEIYASNGSVVSWGSIYCMNVSGRRNVSGSGAPIPIQGAGVYRINGSQIELNYGINNTDVDGLNETFNDTYTDTTGFSVGGTVINDLDGCSLAHPYRDEVLDTETSQWMELLLSDNDSIIFTSIIRQNADGFQPGDTDTYDFQMLVLENGHSGIAAGGENQERTTTPYYFFVELS